MSDFKKNCTRVECIIPAMVELRLRQHFNGMLEDEIKPHPISDKGNYALQTNVLKIYCHNRNGLSSYHTQNGIISLVAWRKVRKTKRLNALKLKGNSPVLLFRSGKYRTHRPYESRERIVLMKTPVGFFLLFNDNFWNEISSSKS